MGEPHLPDEQPRTVLQSGLKSSPYSQRTPSFVQGAPDDGIDEGQSGGLGPGPASSWADASSPAAASELALPPHAAVAMARTTTDPNTRERDVREIEGRMAAPQASHMPSENANRPSFSRSP